MVQAEFKKLEEQLVASASNTLAILEEESKAKEEGLAQRFDDLVEQRKGFTSDKLGKIGQVQEEMARIGEELDRKQEAFAKLRADFENNPLPEAVEAPKATITLAIMGRDDDEGFTELPRDDEDLEEDDDSASLAVRRAMGQKEFPEEKDEKLDAIMADIREYELAQLKREEETPTTTASQTLVEQILKAQEQRTDKQWAAGGGAPTKEAVLAEIEARITTMLDDEDPSADGPLSNIEFK